MRLCVISLILLLALPTEAQTDATAADTLPVAPKYERRISKTVPNNRRKFIKSITAFYELSTCDLYIRSMIQDSNVHLNDIVGLSLDVKLQFM